MSPSRSIVVLLLSTCSLVVACGGADHAAEPKAPSSIPERESEPTTVEEAQDQIARAKAALAGGAEPNLGAGGSTDAKRFSEPPPPAPPPPPPPATTPSTSSTPTRPSGATPRTESSTNADSCQSPCRAIASMRRAVGALCRMTGADDARCVDAKRTLTDSEARVAACACSS